MFIIFKDGSTTDIPVNRIEFKDGVIIGYANTYSAYNSLAERPVAIFSPAHMTAVLDSMPFINPPPAPPTPIPAQLAPAMPHDGVDIT